jgi:hypothetical protein
VADGFFRDRGVEDFRAVAAARGLALRWCPPVPSAGAGAGTEAAAASEAEAAIPPEMGGDALEMAGDATGSPPEFSWPLEAFAAARPFVVELVLSAEARRTEPLDGR